MRQIYTKMLMAIGTIFPLSFLIPAIVFASYSITQLTDNDYNDRDPEINDSGKVVWYGYDGNDDEIFLATPTAHLPKNSHLPGMLLLLLSD